MGGKSLSFGNICGGEHSVETALVYAVEPNPYNRRYEHTFIKYQ